ncbi:DUF4199 domain-containing protein [Tenuifilum osseticum]|uniref:DUF4199 domain-containing protein n=1 Tax=Tenuifilum osseticum TaxID=3374723 RepID=UPI0034E5DCCF
MEKQGNPMLKHSMNYGLIMGVALIILSLITYLAGIVKPPFWVSIINYAIIIGIIVWGTKKYRDEVLEGAITYGNALGFGVLITLFAGVIVAVFTYIQITLIDPDFVSKMLAIAEEELVKRGMPDEQIEMAIEMQKKFMSPLIMTISSLLGMVVMGFIFSLITSIFLKKEKSSFAGDSEVIE